MARILLLKISLGGIVPAHRRGFMVTKINHNGAGQAFIKLLLKYRAELKRLRPRDICVFNVIANYGSYQIIVGPEYSDAECKRLNVKPHSRSIVINGSMHHLFVNPRHVSALPDHEDVRSNLRGSVIMKDIVIHILDQDGRGSSVKITRIGQDGVHAKQNINLAGEKGIPMIENYMSSGRLAIETYKIIQRDILKALISHK